MKEAAQILSDGAPSFDASRIEKLLLFLVWHRVFRLDVSPENDGRSELE